MIASTLLLSGILFLLQGEGLPPGFHLVRTPDGSRFFLHKTKGRPLAVWTYVSRMGRAHEELHLEGLSAACLRASVESKSSRERLAKAPAIRLRLRTGTQTSTLQAILPGDRILAFAALMKQRRTAPSLGGLPQALVQEHEALKREFRNRRDLRPFRQMGIATILRDPVRWVLFAPSEKPATLPPHEALRFFQRHNLPSQGLTLIEGNFDLARVTRGLSHIFTTSSSGNPPRELREEPLPTASRVLRSHRPGNALAALGWRIPKGWSQGELEVLALALQRAEVKGSEGLCLRVLPSFPTMGRPSIFAIQVRALEPGSTSDQLLEHLQKRIATLLAPEGSGKKLISDALHIWQARRKAGFDLPEERLDRLARSLLLGAYAPAPPNPATLLKKARDLLQSKGPCTSLVDPISVTEKVQKNRGDK